MKGSDRDFHVLETDEYVALASSLVAGVRFVYKSVSIRPASLRAPRSVGYHSVGCPLCDLSGGGDEVRRNDASADRLVRRRRGGGKEKKRKNLLVNSSGLLRAVVARNQSQPFESFPPFAIIVGAITAMGGVQYLVHHAYEGKPKPVGADNFDRLLKYRDIRLKDEAKVRFRRRRRDGAEGRHVWSARRGGRFGYICGDTRDAGVRTKTRHLPRRVVVAQSFPPHGRRGDRSASRRGVPYAVLFRRARRGGAVGARGDASVRTRGSGEGERRDHRSTRNVRDAARLGMKRGCDRENTHAQTVIEGNEESRWMI